LVDVTNPLLRLKSITSSPTEGKGVAENLGMLNIMKVKPGPKPRRKNHLPLTGGLVCFAPSLATPEANEPLGTCPLPALAVAE